MGLAKASRDHDLDETESDHDLIYLFEHDLFGKPVSVFPDHALEKLWEKPGPPVALKPRRSHCRHLEVAHQAHLPHRDCHLWYCPGMEIRSLPRENPLL
ncbi:MAG: hypothetical protein ACM3OF_14685 [Gemmatimonas sp.]